MMLQTCFCEMTSTALHCTPRTAFVSLHLTALHCTPLHYTGLTEPVGGALVIDGFFAANRGYVCVVRACASRIVDNIEPPCAVTVVRRRSVAGSRGSSSDSCSSTALLPRSAQCAVRSATASEERRRRASPASGARAAGAVRAPSCAADMRPVTQRGRACLAAAPHQLTAAAPLRRTAPHDTGVAFTSRQMAVPMTTRKGEAARGAHSILNVALQLCAAV
jgi:hypothetical protein